MESQSMMLPFQLHEKASLRRVIESYRENLDWNEIRIVSKEQYRREDFVEKVSSGLLPLYTVTQLILPKKNGRLFLIYAKDILQDFDAK